MGEIYHGLMPLEIDGWLLTIFNDCDTLDYCEYCRSPDGRVGTLELWQRDGADPVELLSSWEREQLERLLAGSKHACKTAGECLATSAISRAASETVAMASFSSQTIAAKPW
jgi:hypothetical protein